MERELEEYHRLMYSTCMYLDGRVVVLDCSLKQRLPLLQTRLEVAVQDFQIGRHLQDGVRVGVVILEQLLTP